jgi:uncharacterized protein YecT (DUF1311 family)
MRIQRFALFAACLSALNSHAATPCGKAPDHLSQVQCEAEQNKRLDDELNAAYKAALSKLPEQDPWDARKGKEQLRKSQRAWLKFKDENCSLVGGLEGGSNLAVSEFSNQCVAGELAERIKFLRRVADGGFGG